MASARDWWHPDRPRWPLILFSAIMLIGLGRIFYGRGFVDHWGIYQRQAKKVDQVTPPNAAVLAEEPIYFFSRRIPPPGLELGLHPLTQFAARGRSPPAHPQHRKSVKRQVEEGEIRHRVQLRRR